MTKLRCFLYILSCFLVLGYCTNPRYYDNDLYNDCFQGAPGWYHLTATCIFPLTQFERNYSTAVQMCGAVNHSIGYRETNWLIASQILEIFTNEQNRNLMKMYWTGLIIKSEVTIGVESEDATESTLNSVADFTSIYNPLWAEGQPSENLPTSELIRSCIALDLRNSSNFGWRVLPCSHQLPILCQNYACLPGTFRCVDNSKCIPASFKNDGFKDCLDGSDESESTLSPRRPSSTPNSLLSSILRENPVYEWPMIVSSGGVLSPTTVKYGRGECTHRWTVLSPNDQHFVIWIKWMSPTTSTTIFVEGKDTNERIFMNSKNSTSSFTFLSSSFVLTASDTDTRKVEFQIHFQEADNSLCRISENNQLIFDSERIPMPCRYHFSTQNPSSYIALLIRKSEGKSPFMSTIRFNNSTVSLAPSPFKKLLVIPSNSVIIDVDSTWPGSETKLDIQFFEITPGAESVDLFLIDPNFEIEWIPKSSDICMEGQFRTLTVNMILTSYSDDSEDKIDETSTWETKNFQKSCSEDNVQIVSTNRTTYVSDLGTITGFGPTTVVIHQSAEPFHFHSIYSIQQRVTEAPDRFLDSISVGIPTFTTTPIGITTTNPRGIGVRCKLPIVVNGYIKSVSYNSISFSYGTVVEINCAQGYILDPLPYTITCDENGYWKDQMNKIYEGDLPTIACNTITCPSKTQLEDQPQLVPDNTDTFYGAVRQYKDVPSEAGVIPFCICGDDIYDKWMCFNYEYLSSIPNACILPQGDNVRFYTQDLSYQNVFSTGYTIRMKCELCPFIEKYYTCQNGLWMTSEGNIQAYGEFSCDCYAEKDPCKPHGTFVEYSGFFGCSCDKGYKFKNNTCEDINECEEQSDYCDPGLSTCVNTQGGFTCQCIENYHNYDSRTENNAQWGSNVPYWIDGYSCIETTCAYNKSWYPLTVIQPPDVANFYKSGTSSGYSYVKDLCNEGTKYPCVYQIQENCKNTTMEFDPDPTESCPVLDRSVYLFDAGSPQFHIFQEIDVSCRVNTQILIGRPTVFCNGGLDWEIKPICVYNSCSNLTDLVKWPLKIKSVTGNGFEITSVVTFECDDGYILSQRTMTCTSSFGNPVWYPDLPTCTSITSTTYPNPASTTLPSTLFSSTPTTTPTLFPWPTTATTRTSHGTTVSQHAPFFNDDVVIEGSMVFQEKNILDQRELWTQTGDWMWTPSGCIIHQWTFPISFFVTSIPIHIDSDQIELLIDISQCNSSVQVGVVSSIDGFIPPISDFRTVMNTTSSGSFVVKLRNLKPFLALSITANGYVQICGVTIRENICNEVDYNGLHLESSRPFSMRRYLPATCTSNQRIAPISGYCDSRRGWVIQNKPCLCNPTPPCPISVPVLPQRDQSGECSVNSCANGACQQHDGYYNCKCNENFINAINTSTGEPYCKPDHCSFTSSNHTSGYNCETGQDDESKTCDDNFFGNFCQFEGEIVGETYIYMLKKGARTAVATNVCESADTEYAIDGVHCNVEPSTTTVRDECFNCYGQCLRNNPYYGGVSCLCGGTGFYGRECLANKNCFDANDAYICLNGGTCHLDGKNTYCNCTSNFSGDYCQYPLTLDQCNGQIDCVNGICRQENGEMYCQCSEGYIWDSDGKCTIPWDMCYLNDVCQQNGICNFDEYSGEITCDCHTSNWEGKRCEIQPKSDNCTVCENAEKCFDVFTSNVRCKCSPGFSGDHCNERIDDCQFEPCFNSGTCNILNYNISNGDLIESYNCTCPTGYSGTNCENRLAPNCSEMITCQNGGTCDLDPFGRSFCKCTDQFYGTYCENSCSDQCPHSYGCINNGTIYCECYSGFSAPLCNVVDDVCKANILVCQNSGTCNSRTQKCDCPDLYNGTYCENNLDKCETESIVCENGGTCIKETGSCECPPNYTGPLCENQIHTCSDITCFNGGTCIPYNATCKCLPGTTGDRCQDLGQPCIIFNPDGSTTPYCLNGGNCLNLPNGAACDCNGTDFTGRRCETRANINFNLVFNGLDYAPDIVSKGFANVSIAQFTICSFIQYNQPTIENITSRVQDVSLQPRSPWLTMRGYGNSQQIVFDNNGFFICDPDKKCSREEISKDTSYKPTPITANTWHHFCLVSPSNLTSPNYTVYLDGALVQYQFAPNFNPGNSGYLQLAPSNLARTRFEGMISMTQLYIIRLNETQIGKLAFDCFATLSDTNSEIANNTLISWNGGFTRVASSNPGVFIDPPGICSSVKCMFGRQPKANNYNSTGSCEKDRIAPTVLRCPSNKYQTTTADFTKVKWSDNDISFFDNIGVVRIVVNYHNGQQFGVGITAVRYIAFDEAGNSAECTFDVVVVQKDCPQQTKVFVEGGTIQFENPIAPYAKTVAKVKCDDNLYPVESRPRFYVCDIMGDYKYGDWEDESKAKYYLPACGKTLPAEQKVNGTVVGSGTCQQVYNKLLDIIWSSANCDESTSCQITILPQCNDTSSGFWSSRATETDSIALQYTFSTNNAIETISTTVLTHLQNNFSVVRQDSSVECNPSFPIHDTNGNNTICVSCPEGTYANTTSNQCLDCPKNTYRNSISSDQLSCTSCPDGTITGDVTGAFDESQCYRNCEEGQYESKGNCLECPEGTFADTRGLRKCICCGFDVSTFGTGKTSIADCTKTCESGQELIRNGSAIPPYCQNCEKGFYKQGNRGPCIQCPRGLTTSSVASKSSDACNQINCIDENTMKNTNITITPNTTYSELCIACEQGTFQNVPNSESCLPCSDLPDDVTDVPITCQSTCSAEIPTEGCNCQRQIGNNSMIIMNCLPEVNPVHTNSNAIKIVLPVVFGVLLIIIVVVLFCFRKQIIAWFRKTENNDNQHVAPSHWQAPTVSIPRPDLRILTSKEEMDRLPPLPPSTPSFHMDRTLRSVGFVDEINSSSGIRHLGTGNSTMPQLNSSNGIFFAENGSPKIIRTPIRRRDTSSDDSSLGSFF
ncbi:unnamed protein product [Caenorhabditis brenneri]